MQITIPAVYMRGGTSKAVFFHENHLPPGMLRREIVLSWRLMEAPTLIAVKLTEWEGLRLVRARWLSLSPSKDPQYDVIYTFGQVSIDKPLIDYKGNCGNISIVDAANPVVFVRARDLGLKGTEITEIDASAEIREKLEAIRSRGAVMIGLASSPEEPREKSQAIPKIAFVSEPQDYKAVNANEIGKDEVGIVARMMSMGALHKAYPVTGAICTAGAARIEGTVVFEMLAKNALTERQFNLGHPGGTISVGADVERRGNSYEYREGVLERTARRLMNGYVYVPEKYFQKPG